MIKIILVFSSFLLPLVLYSKPKESFKWIEREYDFGNIKEDDGEVSGVFRIVNTGKAPLIINNVIPTCGCTNVDFPQKPVLTGDTADISFTFNPLGRPGKFEKTIKVYLNEETGPRRLILKGVVEASENTLRNRYPFRAEQVYYENNLLFAGDIPRGSRRHLFTGLYNNGKDTIKPRWIYESDIIDIKTIPEIIPPKESGEVTFLIDTSKTDKTGDMSFDIKCLTGPSPADSIRITVGVNIIPYQNNR